MPHDAPERLADTDGLTDGDGQLLGLWLGLSEGEALGDGVTGATAVPYARLMQQASTGCEYSVAQEASGQSPSQGVEVPDGVKMMALPSPPAKRSGIGVRAQVEALERGWPHGWAGAVTIRRLPRR